MSVPSACSLERLPRSLCGRFRDGFQVHTLGAQGHPAKAVPVGLWRVWLPDIFVVASIINLEGVFG